MQNIFYNEISPYAAMIPTMFSSGNHEAYSGDQPSFLGACMGARLVNVCPVRLSSKLPPPRVSVSRARGPYHAWHGILGLALLALVQLWAHSLRRVWSVCSMAGACPRRATLCPAADIDQPWEAGSAQHTWVLADLVAVDRASTPWVVAFQHFPLMCSNKFWCADVERDSDH